MKPLGFIKDWKGLIILIATAQLILVCRLCLGESNYMEAQVYYRPCQFGRACLGVWCTLNIAQNQQQISNGTLYIYRKHGEFLNNDSNSEIDGDLYQKCDTLDPVELNCVKDPKEDATCDEYKMTYRCLYSYEVDDCGNTSKVNTSVDVKFPDDECNSTLEKKKVNLVTTNNDHCPTHNVDSTPMNVGSTLKNDGNTSKNDGSTPKNDDSTPKNDDNTPENSQVVTTVAIVLPLLAVVATVAGYWYCQKKKEEIVPAKEDKKEENVSEAVEPATVDVSSDQTMDDAASMNADDAASGMSKATDASSERSDDKRSSVSSGSSDASSVKTVDESPV